MLLQVGTQCSAPSQYRSLVLISPLTNESWGGGGEGRKRELGCLGEGGRGTGLGGQDQPLRPQGSCPPTQCRQTYSPYSSLWSSQSGNREMEKALDLPNQLEHSEAAHIGRNKQSPHDSTTQSPAGLLLSFTFLFQWPSHSHQNKRLSPKRAQGPASRSQICTQAAGLRWILGPWYQRGCSRGFLLWAPSFESQLWRWKVRGLGGSPFLGCYSLLVIYCHLILVLALRPYSGCWWPLVNKEWAPIKIGINFKEEKAEQSNGPTETPQRTTSPLVIAKGPLLNHKTAGSDSVCNLWKSRTLDIH